jgi:hypothetical protein
VILDEIGRGTSTFDGLSIAWAVAEFLLDLQAKKLMVMIAVQNHCQRYLKHYLLNSRKPTNIS